MGSLCSSIDTNEMVDIEYYRPTPRIRRHPVVPIKVSDHLKKKIRWEERRIKAISTRQHVRSVERVQQFLDNDNQWPHDQ